jgi:subtilase family serine protease
LIREGREEDVLRVRSTYFAVAGLALLSSASFLEGQMARHVPQITQPVSEARLATLQGNIRKEAVPANDLGRVEENYALDHLHVQLRRSPEDEKALDDFINQLHDPASPFYHQWLSAPEIGQRFGAAREDVQAVTQWLTSRGFTVHGLSSDGMMIDFSGNAGLVRSAFRTELHRLNVNGRTYVANMSDPRIPAALAPAIAGIVSLNNFHPQSNLKARSNFTVNTNTQLLVPGDIATIYNFKPAYAAGLSGQGQKIVLIEDSDMFSTADWTAFRNTMGLAAYNQGSLSTVQPAGGTAGPCADPGANADDSETTLDAEWASAAAPNAAIVIASCANTNTNFGGFIALENLLTNGQPVPSIISISFGDPESDLGQGGNAYVKSLYQTAVLRGISIFVSTGDTGAAVVDHTGAPATHGINTSGFATTPYNVAVGGTDFSDSVQGANALYWNKTNAADFSSATSYVPEMTWNDSCASTVTAQFITGSATTYGPIGLCNQASAMPALSFLINDVAAGGGPSACATGTSAHFGVIGGTCKGYPKPSWQAGLLGIVNDGVRDIPDVSLFAANGIWGHFYVVCFSDARFGGTPCSGPPATWAGFGGTSVSTPIMAGIQALINQHAGSKQGNPAPIYYALAAAEYGPTGNLTCQSNLGSAVSRNCIFYDVTLGDIDVPCGISTNCYRPGGTITSLGVLSTSTTAYQPAYAAGAGWDFATGIGTVNVFNLIMNWP